MFQVVRLVEQDPSLVRRVWIQASSGSFAHPPSGLHHAIARIGFDALWRIGMSICLHSAVFRVRGYQEQADHARSHGVACAELAAWITDDKRGEVFLAGLLHDIGKLVVYRAACVRDDTDRARPRLVHRLATELHAGIGLLAVHAWQLSDRVAAAVGFHHHPDRAPEEAQDLAEILWVTDVAFHTADQARLGRECGGLAALKSVEGMEFDAARLMEKAHALLVEMEGTEEAAKA
jgi:HD-like signal output (HDOD) protein